MSKATTDPVMGKIREIWAKRQAGGMTLDELGRAMGARAGNAKQSASQFLGGNDPRISTLRRFARAVGMSPATLVRG